MSVVKAFFEFCLANEWILRNPARRVRNQRGKYNDPRSEQKLPFNDAELQRMYHACETKYGKREINFSNATAKRREQGSIAQYRSKWTGQDLADFISVSVYTGLRISDVSTFHIDRMRPDGTIQLRTTKAHTHVYTWVPEWLRQRIRERASTVGPYIFGEHSTTDMNVITDLWRRKLNKLWSLCGPWKDRPTPHRFRHTFARILLERDGVTVRDVAELLGNTEQMVRKHYAAWIPERQDRLTAILKGGVRHEAETERRYHAQDLRRLSYNFYNFGADEGVRSKWNARRRSEGTTGSKKASGTRWRLKNMCASTRPATMASSLYAVTLTAAFLTF